MAKTLQSQEDLHIYWDYETTKWTNASTTTSNHSIVKHIKDAAKPFGPIKSLRAYADFSAQALPKSLTIRSELSSSGVTLIDCPGDGRRELSAKIMIVDIMIHAWDHSPPCTFVLITEDRDLAYTVSTLRTRGYRVIVVSPSTTHTDLVLQGSIHLDWTRVILGINDGLPVDDNEYSGSSSAPPKELDRPQPPQTRPTTNNSTSHSQSKEPFHGHSLDRTEQLIRPQTAQFRRMSSFSRGNSTSFSYPDSRRNFDIFRNAEGEGFPMPETRRDAFGFDDGPLFPRPPSQARADSAPPNIRHSSTVQTPRLSSRPSADPFTRIGGIDLGGSGGGKGKERESMKFDSDNVLPEISPVSPSPVPAQPPYTRAMFEPFGRSTSPFRRFSESPPPLDLKSQVTRTSSLSSSSSTVSKFSVIQIPEISTAPTSANPQVVDKNDGITKSQAFVSNIAQDQGTSIPAAEIHSSKLPPILSDNIIPIATSMVIPNQVLNTDVKIPITDPATNGGANKSSPKIEKASNVDRSNSTVGPISPHVSTLPVSITVAPISNVVKNVTKSPPLPARVSTPVNKLSTPKPVSQPLPPKQPLPSQPSSSSTVLVPARFTVLVDILRRHSSRPVTRTQLGGNLLKENPNVYKSSGLKKFTVYIAEAVRVGIVEETVNNKGEQCIVLRNPYA